MSRNLNSHAKSIFIELLAMSGLVAISIATLLPMIQQGDRIMAKKHPSQKVMRQPLVSHRGTTPQRAASL